MEQSETEPNHTEQNGKKSCQNTETEISNTAKIFFKRGNISSFPFRVLA